MTTDSLSQMLSDFLDGAHAAVVVEDGAIAFDLAESKYSVSARCTCILRLTRSCVICRRRSIGIGWELTSAGGRRYGLCSGSGQCARHAWRFQLDMILICPSVLRAKKA